MGMISELLGKLRVKSRMHRESSAAGNEPGTASGSSPRGAGSPRADPHAPPPPALTQAPPHSPPPTRTPSSPGPDAARPTLPPPPPPHTPPPLPTPDIAAANSLKSILSEQGGLSSAISHNVIFPNSSEAGPSQHGSCLRLHTMGSECMAQARPMGTGLTMSSSEPITHSPLSLQSSSVGHSLDTRQGFARSRTGCNDSPNRLAPRLDGPTLAAFEARSPWAAPPISLSRTGLSCSVTSAELSEWDEDGKGDLRSFASRIVHDGGWVRLGPEERSVIIDHYRSKGLNLEALLSQVQREARAAVMNNKLSDLEYINWDDMVGRRGSTSALERIRTGSKATLYRGRWHGEDVVVKKMDGADTKRMQDELSREIYIMSTCTHPNIARIFGIAREPLSEVPCIVMKFYKKGSLLDVMTAPEAAAGFSLAARVKMARGIARGMQYLHDRPNEMITHGDLNPRNILVDERMRPIITDFGLSSMKTQTKTLVSSSGTRSVLYTAPEVLPLLMMTGGQDYKPSPRADVYSFSMILFELFSGVVPFCSVDMTEDKVLRLTGGGHRPSISRLDAQGGCPEPRAGPGVGVGMAGPLADIVERCWDQDPGLRPSFAQVIPMLEAAAAALQLQLD